MRNLVCACAAESFSLRDDPLDAMSFPVTVPVFMVDKKTQQVAKFTISTASELEKWKSAVGSRRE